MKKTSMGLIIAVAAIIFNCNRPPEKKEIIKESKPVQVTNEYPNMTLIMTDGSLRMTKELPAKSILFLYFPDCDHCQREALETSNHLKAFENYSLWFITTANYKDIERFARDYKLFGYANIHFVRTEMQDVINNFGAIPTPSVYIFSEEKKLIKGFNGETKIEEIIKWL